MPGSDGFRLPGPLEPLYLEDDGEWHTFGELTAGLEPEFLPTDREDMRLFLVCYDAWPAHEPAA